MLRNLASALILTERDAELDPNPPKVKGRIITTLQKAKEVRPLVEKCVTIARHSLEHEERAEQYATAADRRSPEWNEWRHGARWHEWCQARAPVVAARRRVLQLLGDKQAVSVLFADIAPRFADRAGGYTRILRLAKPRLGDAGTRAILEFVGQHDRVATVSQRPLFEDTGDEVKPADDEVLEMDPGSETSAPDDADAIDRDAAGTDEARQQGER
jgi:large subunit ribosomal protein L17